MRLAAAGRAHRRIVQSQPDRGRERHVGRNLGDSGRTHAGEDGAVRRNVDIRLINRRDDGMVVVRDLVGGERDALHTPLLAELIILEARALPGVDRQAALQVRHVESFLTIAAIGGADQSEESVILGDRHGLAVAKSPAGGREAAPEHANSPTKGCPIGPLPEAA